MPGFKLPEGGPFLYQFQDFYRSQWDPLLEADNNTPAGTSLAALRLERLDDTGRAAFHSLQSKFMKWALFPQYGSSIQLTRHEAWLLGFDGTQNLSLRPEDIQGLYERLHAAIKIINDKHESETIPDVWDRAVYISNEHLLVETKPILKVLRSGGRVVGYSIERVLAASNEVQATIELLKSCLGQLRKLYRKLRVLQYARSQSQPRLTTAYSGIRRRLILSGIPQPAAELNSFGLFNSNFCPVGFDHDPLVRIQHPDGPRPGRRVIYWGRPQRPKRRYRSDPDPPRRQEPAPGAFHGRSALPFRSLRGGRMVRHVQLGQS